MPPEDTNTENVVYRSDGLLASKKKERRPHVTDELGGDVNESQDSRRVIPLPCGVGDHQTRRNSESSVVVARGCGQGETRSCFLTGTAFPLGKRSKFQTLALPRGAYS